MNQSGQLPSQSNDDKEHLSAGEFVYQFFQPTFETSLNYEFSSGPAVTTPTAKVPSEPVQLQPVQLQPVQAQPVQAQPVQAQPVAIETAPAPSAKELRAVDDSGAVLSYGLWNILPHHIRYPDKSVAQFEYDEAGQLIHVIDRDGSDWVRLTQPDHKNIAAWKSADGRTCDMSMVVIPDGTYQCTNADNIMLTCTLSGRVIVWTAFTDGFDLKRTLFSIFRRVDANQDSGLSKEELDTAARQVWHDPDAVQLIKMLQTHYDAICYSRKHALCRQGAGITIDDILGFDAATASEQDARSTAPPHVVTRVRMLFDELNTSPEKVVTIHQVRIAYDKRHLRDSVTSTILKTLYEELKRANESANPSFASQTNNLTRSDLVQNYKNGYKREIKGQIKISGWGADDCGQTGDASGSQSSIYIDAANPMESILPKAIKQIKPDTETAVFRAILEALAAQCPHLIVRMLSQSHDGEFTVSFPGLPHEKLSVELPNKEILSSYVHINKFGSWMAILEEAYKKHEASRTGINDLDHFEKAERIFKLLLGQKGKLLNLKSMQLSNLGSTLRDVFKQRRVMIAIGKQNTPRVSGNKFVSRSSVCGIVDFDFKNGRITVSDALKENCVDSGSDPLNHTLDGSVLVSLSAFADAFDFVYVEDWQPTDDMFQK